MLTLYEMNGPRNGKAILPTTIASIGGHVFSLGKKQASGRAIVA